MRTDPAVMRHLGDGATKSEEEAWSSFLQVAGHWQMTGFGSWAVEEKASGNVIGSVGFQDRKRDRGPELRGLPEAGWMFARSAWGKGYATEALRSALSWAKMHFGAIRVIALTTHDNLASIRVAQKCGFRKNGPIVSAGRPRLLLDRML
jgi:RimJ/RimL family protein N-acetyltransferase